ncbi:hypothetical protein [Luteithermobacter gelatinilyticus]|uniref:hypothetical protein n=1 Tax=Luteithermobacter gelatinilyticus TaxID=2582913 RepID=UPI00110601D7|nr:hypothetical protein [Luteithermobacter gelatinilyticus]
MKRRFRQYLIITAMALSAVMPGRAIALDPPYMAQELTIFSGTAREAFDMAAMVVLARPVSAPVVSGPRDQRPVRYFEIVEVLKGPPEANVASPLQVKLPGQLISAYFRPQTAYVLFLLGGGETYSLMTHSLSYSLAFAVDEAGYLRTNRLPPDGWAELSLESLRMMTAR